VENEQIANRLDEIADLLELQEGNEFRIRSYRNAARTVRDYPARFLDLIADGKDLTEIPNVGASIAKDIEELLTDGQCKRLDRLRREGPSGLPEIMHIRGLGARKAMKLYRELGIENVEQLRKACQNGEVRKVKGFGGRTEENILKAIRQRARDSGRFSLRAATEHAESLGRFLGTLESIDRWQIAGSFRRRKETVGDLDVVLQAADRNAAVDDIAAYDAIDTVVSRGEERATMQLDSGLRVDFRFFEPKNFGAALMYFTGSKEHNVALRKRAKERGWKMNEYGITKNGRMLAAKEEDALYHRLNMDWVPPELREDRGEIVASESHALPRLIELRDIRGDLHCHTDETDGEDSLHDMVEAARSKGYAYMAVTDHSKAVRIARGMDEKRLRRHVGRIRKTDAAIDDFRVFAGIEVDILENGELDIDPEVLAELDWVVASVHSHFDLPEKEMTERLLRAIASGVVHCLGHPFCREIGHRDSISFDAEEVFSACAEAGVLLEVNANPVRLDLPDVYCKLTKECGAMMVVSTDAHRTTDLELMRYGIDVARRGWLERSDVANTRDLEGFLPFLERTGRD
jgi:DNA polymerase (family 10)